ncbi:MAG: DNA polymerase, partial [Candidatus Heimdallarchaeota archaeon LC_2]
MQIFINENQVHCEKCEYILDIHFDGHITHIWTKTIAGETKHYPIHYHPRIYIAPPLTETIYQYNHDSLEEIAKNVAMHPDVIAIREIDCYLSSKSDSIVKALEVEIYSLKVMPHVIRDLKQKNYYLYNVDINKRQHFFLDTNAYPLGACHIHTRDTTDNVYLRFEPLAHRNELYRNDYSPIPRSVELRMDNPITMYDDVNKIDYYVPPLKILRVDPMIDKKVSFNTYKDQLSAIKLQYGIYEDHELTIRERLEFKMGKHTKPLESKANLIPFVDAESDSSFLKSAVSTEGQLLLKLVEYIKEHDIDIILLPLGDKFTMNYLAHRAKHNKISDRFVLGRLPQPQYARKDQKSQVWVTYGQILNKAAVMYLPGRIHLDYDNSFILYEGELAGVIDMTRMSATPMERTSRASIGTTLTGIEFVISQNTIPRTLVPENKVGGEQLKDSDLLLIADNGGLTYPAIAGVYDQVWAMDFTSLYPMIMMKHNVGSETVLCEHENCTDKNIVPELGYHICNMRECVVTKTMKLILSKRVTMKYMKKTLKEKKRVDRYKGMDSALKWILVCCFEGSTRVLVRKNGEYLSERLDTIVNEFTDTDKLEALGMDEQGQPEFKPVKGVIKIRPETPVFRVQFQGGKTAVATADHLWPVRTSNDWQNVRTDQLTKDHWIPQLEQFRNVSNKLSDKEIQRLERLEVLAEAPMHFTRV